MRYAFRILALLGACFATRMATPQEAAEKAMKNCETQPTTPKDCQLKLQTAAPCMVFALSATNTATAWGAGWANTGEDAGKQAIAACKVMANAPCAPAYANCGN
ncbi:MAG: DUF4189 domain-containing protein [Rickettsiales bacterium]|nr:DUF4189 domain-containing protein [Rickettsiales bacterium]